MPRARAPCRTNLLGGDRLSRNPQRYRRHADRSYGREPRRLLGGAAPAHGTKTITWRCERGRRRPPDVPRRMAATRADPDGVSISPGTGQFAGWAIIYFRRENLGGGSQDCSESIIGDPRDH